MTTSRLEGRKVLFIGGTGVISSACARRAVELGADLHVLNRGVSSVRPVPDGVTLITADVHDTDRMRAVVKRHEFDVVVNFLNFTADHIARDVDLFGGRTGQYVFISSAATYERPAGQLPLEESAPLRNPHSAYARNKIACEELLAEAHRERQLPVTVVRPSHTYDRTAVPFDGGWTAVERMRRGQEVLVHGDGTSLWTLTHHTDFAVGFTGLLGHPEALGETFHITGDEVLSWDQIYRAVAAAAGVDEPRLVHVPSHAIAAADPRWGEELLGDKAHSMTFDNTKVRRLVPGFTTSVPFSRGAREIVTWYDADPARRVVDARFDALMDVLIDAHRPGRP
ncbi:NAD-dependent dehydratase [Streptomyces sp. AS58]|uniref:NAD-dependent dehydratase n=1 Tax=Streptomyces cadmiisoli TaxID=2184053 RepID=A0A2Z4JDQ1_9ACTN|nr:MULTISPECIES: NAD-dependent epimerase/dehydratase family protein [Streptomyces]AWW43196.1 NAD-dependent dehydratase [Streptomyces cadmiisoli]KOV51034.1 NAD-dependent dehydratase [Streptomyces sp. AS58]